MSAPGSTRLSPRLVRPAEGETHVAGAERVTFLLMGGDTEDTLTLGLVTLAPGGGLPPHVHRREDEVLVVLAGEIEVWLPTGWQVARPGDVVFLPADVPHGYRNVAGEPARFYLIATPSGLEGFYARLAQLAGASGTPAPGRVALAAEEHGLSFLPAPP